MPNPVRPLLPAAWLQLRIVLRWVEPQVWRVVLVPETITLPKLHHVIQAAMGWYDCHLHEFVIGERHYGVPDPDGWDPLPVTSEKGVPLLKALGRGKRLKYLYDFGDGWEHTVTVERRLPPPLPGSRLGVMCVAGENACPPEDVGGRRVTRTSCSPSPIPTMRSMSICSHGAAASSIPHAATSN